MKNTLRALMLRVTLATSFLTASATALAQEVSICTGSEGGFYNAIGTSISRHIGAASKGDIKPEVYETNGSVENIEYFKDGECQVMVAQGDSLAVYDVGMNVDLFAAHTETVYWVYNKESGITDLEDIEKSKEYRVVIVDGSGSDVTLQNFAKEDKGYQINYDNAIYADDTYDAVSIVANGVYNYNGEQVKVAGTLLVTRAGVISDEIVQDFKGKVAIGELTDGDFNDAKDAMGNKLYNTCEIEKKHTKGLDRATWGSQDTICMSAFIVLDRSMFDALEDKRERREASRSIKKGINKAIRGLE